METVSYTALTEVIRAIEKDFRNIVSEFYLGENYEALFEGILESMLNNFKRDPYNENRTFDELAIDEMLEYTNFIDPIKIISKKKNNYSTNLVQFISQNRTLFEKVSSIRNRAYHTRSLHIEDLDYTQDLLKKILDFNTELFSETRRINTKLEKERDGVLDNKLTFHNVDSKVNHNLPNPDYVVTNFIGRKDEINRLQKWLRSPWPLAVIYGEGGLGKTSLALYFVWDLISNDDCNFEYIFWVESKKNRIKGASIEDIKNAISTSDGVYDQIRELTGAKDEKIDEILELYSESKILLVLDNIETVLDQSILTFLESINQNWRILITSRIKIPDLGFPIKLSGMTIGDSVKLIYSYSKHLNFDCSGFSQNKIRDWCEKMENNPGFIKWFLNLLENGKSPSEILKVEKSKFISFSHENILRNLPQNAIEVLKYLLVINKYWTEQEIHTLIGGKIDITDAIQQISRTPFLITKQAFSEDISAYKIKDNSINYLNSIIQPEDELKNRINEWYKKENKEYQSINLDISKYNPNYITPSKIYKSTIIRLRIILEKSKQVSSLSKSKSSFSNIKANELKSWIVNELEALERLSPDFFEVYRVSAFIQKGWGNVENAKNYYSKAIELNNDSSTLYYFASICFAESENNQNYLSYIEKARELDPNSIEVNLQYAKCINIRGDIKASIEFLDENCLDSISTASKKDILIFCNSYVKGIQHLISDLDSQRDYDSLHSYLKKFLRVFNNQKSLSALMYDNRLQSRCNTICSSVEDIIYKLLRNKLTTDLPIIDDLTNTTNEILSILKEDKINLSIMRTKLSSQYRGSIISIHPCGMFGNIKVSNSQETLYFHKKECHFARYEQVINSSYLSKSVVFMKGNNTEGVCAVTINLDDEDF